MEMFFFRIADRDYLAELIESFNLRGSPVVLDLETTGLDRFKDTIVSAQLCVAGDTTAYYIEKELVDELRHLTCPLVLHNFKFDFAFLLRERGIDLRVLPGPDGTLCVRRSVHDTMLMHHLLDENAEHGLDTIVKERWNDPYKETFWSRHKSFQEAPAEEQVEYACKDVIYTGLLYNNLCVELSLSEVPDSLVAHCHLLALALYDTEVRGVRVDLDYLVKVGAELRTRIDAAVPKMHELATDSIESVELSCWLASIQKAQAKLKTDKGKESCAARIKRKPFNWNSGPQMKQLVYGELGLPVQYKYDRKKRERRPTLNDDALVALADHHPMLAELRDYRDADKVYGTFIQGTLERHVGGRIYPSFNVNGTVSGRISSSDPNLQNLPREGGVRGIYTPDEGHKFISCDYAMLEVVVAAHYSQDPSLLKIILDGTSKHDITAEALGIPRQLAKTVNFAMQYLCKPPKVASILGCSKADGQLAWNKYWEAYAGEKKVVDECARRVDRGEPIISLFGRRRRFPKVFASNGEKEAAYRQAYSSLISGTGADITHTAYYTLCDDLERRGNGRVVLQVHDEILVQAKDGRTEEVTGALKSTMLDAGKVLSVKLGVDCSDPLERWQKG